MFRFGIKNITIYNVKYIKLNVFCCLIVRGFVFRKDKEMESKTARMESRVAESQILLESHRNEMISFKEANHRLQVVNTFYNLLAQCLRSMVF